MDFDLFLGSRLRSFSIYLFKIELGGNFVVVFDSFLEFDSTLFMAD